MIVGSQEHCRIHRPGPGKTSLSVFIEAAKRRGEPLDHTLLYGPPGLGKTTLASIIATEMAVSLRVTSGPAIERAGDLVSILTNLKAGDVLFIDEIHRLNRVEEVLYPRWKISLDTYWQGLLPVRCDQSPASLSGATPVARMTVRCESFRFVLRSIFTI